MDDGAGQAQTGRMDMRRHGLTRRSALTAVAATGLIVLTTMVGTSAVAAPRSTAHVERSVTTTIADVRLPAAPAASDHVMKVMRYGSCDANMVDL
jgi:hypothetical protein